MWLMLMSVQPDSRPRSCHVENLELARLHGRHLAVLPDEGAFEKQVAGIGHAY